MTPDERRERIRQARAERDPMERAYLRQTIANGPTGRKPKPVLRKLTIAEHMDRAVHHNQARRVS